MLENKKKKGIYIIFAMILFVSLILSPCISYRGKAGEKSLSVYGAGNSISEAMNINLETQYSGSLGENNKEDWYSFTIGMSGTVSLSCDANMYSLNYKIYDIDGNEVWNKYDNWNDTTRHISTYEAIYLTSGDYYFVL